MSSGYTLAELQEVFGRIWALVGEQVDDQIPSACLQHDRHAGFKTTPKGSVLGQQVSSNQHARDHLALQCG